MQTRVFWLPSTTAQLPQGREYQRAERIRVLVIPSAPLPEIPRGTDVAVPEEEGGPVLNWKTDATERMDSDHHRAIVVPA